MKRILITGIRRIGFYIARHLIQSGQKVAFVYHTSKQVALELEKMGGIALRADLSKFESYSKVVEETLSYLGGIDALIHTASPYFSTPLKTLSREDLYAHFTPNAEAFLMLCKLLYPHMLNNPEPVKGRMVAFGDWATNTTPYRDYSAYFVSKGALHTAVKVLAKELAPHVLVNAIALGPTLKPDEFSQEKWKEYINKTPLKREVSMQDVLMLTEFLLNVESMTGEIINLDSGRHISGECT
ncbi:MAG: SDR family oxidoreductase [Hydrogenobacter thermophilus]|uniref:SDR family oxidoreductase n=1 Tax=Hydrogenobacter thermophilus TaxID=940 RepID=UPI001C7660FF|nr:SDR family oxidoreductase [Hydrogenobacter thermophilus]QWK18940.1 MAG: SDR family oxidoreductase [Hydrogenobacter thermophilus]